MLSICVSASLFHSCPFQRLLERGLVDELGVMCSDKCVIFDMHWWMVATTACIPNVTTLTTHTKSRNHQTNRAKPILHRSLFSTFVLVYFAPVYNHYRTGTTLSCPASFFSSSVGDSSPESRTWVAWTRAAISSASIEWTSNTVEISSSVLPRVSGKQK
jgi:hypothetical protein